MTNSEIQLLYVQEPYGALGVKYKSKILIVSVSDVVFSFIKIY